MDNWSNHRYPARKSHNGCGQPLLQKVGGDVWGSPSGVNFKSKADAQECKDKIPGVLPGECSQVYIQQRFSHDHTNVYYL